MQVARHGSHVGLNIYAICHTLLSQGKFTFEDARRTVGIREAAGVMQGDSISSSFVRVYASSTSLRFV